MSNPLSSSLEILQKAITLDTNGKVQESISMYSLAIEHLRQAVDNKSLDNNLKQQIQSKIQEYSKRVDYLRSTLTLNGSNNIVFPSIPTMSNSTEILSKDTLIENALKYATLGVKSEQEQKFKEAIQYYTQSSENIEQALKFVQSGEIESRLMLTQKKQEYSSRAEYLSNLHGIRLSGSSGINSSGSTAINNSNSNVPFPQVEEMEQSQQQYIFQQQTITTTMSSNIDISKQSSEYIDMAIALTKEAIKEDDVHNFVNAIQYYDQSVLYFQAALQIETNDQVRRLIGEKLTNSTIRSTFLKNKIQYQGGQHYNEISQIPMGLKPGQKYHDPVRKKTALEKLMKTIKGPKNISDHWL
ncbi:hypothetical protein DLAC_10682 [Tieghemostelium lacteum]|uniref:MIT domain-containing protein n=1 Tax=Tieghemostelium lacteum TaxID=361077 RepID=A0A151Z4Z9_TIELA|nr:hypothetical protein DLAC_10682 [Tieghemostelium lacteum]|eukprot:KYQ88874.1 hypothetical protein DLAC_10682 [Tieghemostelium lacteum]